MTKINYRYKYIIQAFVIRNILILFLIKAVQKLDRAIQGNISKNKILDYI